MECDEDGKPSTPRQREEVFRQLQALKAFRQYMEGLVRRGKMVEREIAMKEAAR